MENELMQELSRDEQLLVNAGGLSDFGEWLTDVIASGVCSVKNALIKLHEAPAKGNPWEWKILDR